MPSLKLHNRFSEELPADALEKNVERQVPKACFSYVTPRKPGAPRLVQASVEAAALIGLGEEDLNSPAFLEIISGTQVLPGSRPYAMRYGGHQFGFWAGQLGDGRAINLGEFEHAGSHWALQLKGAGKTPYSRGADGLAVLRSSIREHLCSEAMYHLGVPTTRSLSLAITGDQVMRDMLYDGNAALEPGAVVCRMARSFVRFGSFEIFAADRDRETMQLLADHVIRHHYPEFEKPAGNDYAGWFNEVCQRTLDMVIHWMRVGFVHGVMNTDNMSILGDTIDYGPYGWLEGYDETWTPNTTDREQRRYRYGTQVEVSLWNLSRLARALLLLTNEPEPLEEALMLFQNQYGIRMLSMYASKLGLQELLVDDADLVVTLKQNLSLTETDFTLFFRGLSDYRKGVVSESGDDFLRSVKHAFYEQATVKGEVLEKWRGWFRKYDSRLEADGQSDEERKVSMDNVNPKYVLRNYMAQLAIDDAEKGDYQLIDTFYTLLKKPYDEQPEYEKWYTRRPEWARHKVGCSMLSCSS